MGPEFPIEVLVHVGHQRDSLVLGDFDAEKVCDEPHHNALDGLEIGPIAQRQLALIDVMVECTANKAVGTHEQEDGQDCAYHQTHTQKY